MSTVRARTKYGNPYTLGSNRSAKACKGTAGRVPQLASAVKSAFWSPVIRQRTASQAMKAAGAQVAVASAPRAPVRRNASIAIGSATAAPTNARVCAASTPRAPARSHSPRRAWYTAPIESARSSDSGYTTLKNMLVGKTSR